MEYKYDHKKIMNEIKTYHDETNIFNFMIS